MSCEMDKNLAQLEIIDKADGTKLRVTIIDFDPFKPRKEHLLLNESLVGNCRCEALPYIEEL